MTKKIVAINAGSSSLKFQLFDMPEETTLIKGIFEKIGSNEGIFSYVYKKRKKEKNIYVKDHQQAVEILLKMLLEEQVIQSFDDIIGVGHRVAHGGEYFKNSSLIGEKELRKIEELSDLAPIHNPINVVGIKAFTKVLPKVVPVAVFDTAFHQTLKKEKYIYPIPYKYYQKYGVRKYGFHGTSHQFVSQEVIRELGQDKLKIVSCHLGNGASLCAIKKGISVNTSMGFTPLSGLMMGTRSGDIDPSILPFLAKKEGMGEQDLDDMLNRESGLLGVSEVSNDYRNLEEAALLGNQKAQLALDMFADRIIQTIGSYSSDMNGIDVLLFTAGIGENSRSIRQKVCNQLTFMGVELDKEKNQKNDRWIHSSTSKVKIGIIPTNEEVMIARDTYQLTK